MLNNFTLNFKQPNLEKEYRNDQQERIKREYCYFTIQCLFFFPFYILFCCQGSSSNILNIEFISAIIMIILLFRFLIVKCFSSVNVVLPIVQLLLCVIWKVDNLMEFKAEQKLTQYTWMQGFQACYFHLAVMSQGYQVIPQSISIVILYLFNSIFFAENKIESISQIITQFVVVIGFIVIKYTNERLRRFQFIDNREKNKWVKIIEQISDQQIILVSFDKRQDQLVIQQMKEETKIKFQIHDNTSFRQFLRDIQILNSTLSQGKFNSGSLETEIRQLYTTNQQQIIPTYEVISHSLKQEFRVKLIQYIFQEIQCVLVVFDSEQRKEIKQCLNHYQITESLFVSFSSKLLASIQKTNRLVFLQSLVNLQMFRIWVDSKSYVHEKILISTCIISSRLQHLLNQTIILKDSLEEYVFISVRTLEMILIGLTQIMLTKYQIHITFKEKHNIKKLRCKIITKECLITQRQFNKVRRLLDLNEPSKIINREKIIQNIEMFFSKQNVQAKEVVFVFLMCQYLLWHGFNQSQIRYKEIDSENKVLSFDIIV